MENQNQGSAPKTTTTTNLGHHPYNGSGGREDCWTEGATAVLIEAWGNRYLELSRGNLRQNDWKDVADSVNNYHLQQGNKKSLRTDIQCKNRIDTIKKKYKSEKSKPNPSQWPFFGRLDSLVGANLTPVNKKLSSSPQPIHYRTPGGGVILNSPNSSVKPNLVMYSGGMSRLNEGEFRESSEGEDDYDNSEGEEEGEEGEEEVEELVFNKSSGQKKRRGGGEDGRGGGGGGGEGYRELAKAVVKFGEMYERIECSKQQQMMELERQRMEFTKEIEFQRMQMFMEAQLKVEKRKRPKHSSSASNGAGVLMYAFQQAPYFLM